MRNAWLHSRHGLAGLQISSSAAGSPHAVLMPQVRPISQSSSTGPGDRTHGTTSSVLWPLNGACQAACMAAPAGWLPA